MKFQVILQLLSYFITVVSAKFNCAEEDYCLNGGICEGVLVGTKTVVTKCLCNYRFTGPRCEYKKCPQDPCQNGGFCQLVGRSLFKCHCQQGFKGDFCHIKIPNACDSIDCGSHGKCVLLDGSFNDGVCECDPGFTGEHCELNVDDCGNNLCAAGSMCIDKVAGYECLCSEGRFGMFCQYENRCLKNNPCVHGDCYTTSDGLAKCFCQVGFTGPNCDQDVDECQSNPCGRNGTCINSFGSYKCECNPEFSGIHCDQDKAQAEKDMRTFLVSFMSLFFIAMIGFVLCLLYFKSYNVVYNVNDEESKFFSVCKK